MDLPAQVPLTLSSLLTEFALGLGPLMPLEHAQRIARTWGDLSLMRVGSFGFEVVLPPDQAACDASLLLSPGVAPPGLDSDEDLLRELNQYAADHHKGTVWWEYDASLATPRMGTFWRIGDDSCGFGELRETVAGHAGLVAALDVLEPWYERWGSGAQGLLGVFPSRRPPAAGMLLPIWPEVLEPAIERLRAHGACVSLGHPRVKVLRDACTGFALALGADAQGRLSVSLEAHFHDRERAMMRGDWNAVLASSEVWQCPKEVLDSVLGIQAQRRYDVFPPLAILTGIDHVKVGPTGRAKAYVGALPLGAAIPKEQM